MAAVNTIALAEKVSGELDKAVVQKSVTGFLADNAFRAKFMNADTVLLTDIDFVGLGDYNRSSGFVDGAITTVQTPYTLTMDRGRTLSLDRLDAEESGVENLAGQVMGEFLRMKVIPEMDAYVLSKIAAHAIAGSQTVTGTLANGSFKLFKDACIKVWAQLGYDEPLVAFVNDAFYADLMSTTELTRQITISDFKRGGIDTKVQSINGVPILPVPSSRMKTEYLFNDGTTSGQTAGGFTPDVDADDVGLIVMPKRGASLIKRHEKPRIFAPDTNQQMDAWKFDYRFCYDLLIKKSLTKGPVVYTY